MIAKGLRPGNVVFVLGELREVVSVRKEFATTKMLNINERSIPYGSINSCVLTHKLLLQVGFKKIKGSGFYYQSEKYSLFICELFSKMELSIFSLTGITTTIFTGFYTIHGLQNIVYDLTGQELNLKFSYEDLIRKYHCFVPNQKNKKP